MAFQIEAKKHEIIAGAGGIAGYFSEYPINTKRQFEEQSVQRACHACTCSDEGAVRKRGDRATPGNLALMARKYGLDAAAEYCRQGNIGKIVSHHDCGAMKALFIQDFNREPVGNELDEYTRKTRDELAISLSSRIGRVLAVSHIPSNDMLRPGYHVATCMWYSTIPRFTPGYGFMPGMLPTGFSLQSRFYPDQKMGVEEAEVLIGIAFGPHGYNGLFSEQDPFVIYVVGESGHEEFDPAKIGELLLPLAEENKGKIRIDTVGFPLNGPD